MNFLQGLLLVITILLITIVLLQSGKAEGASQVIMGGDISLFAERKERGAELFISRLTMFLGISFFVVSLILSFMK
jgi:preprotein translocase subunit SecG